MEYHGAISQSDTNRTHALACSVCGANAGRWLQHSNRDTGWGLCRKCADWLESPTRGRHVSTPEEMQDLYGLPGLHYEPHMHVLHGRQFAIVAKFQNDDDGTVRANEFMEHCSGVGVIEVVGDMVILAHNSDKGVSA